MKWHEPNGLHVFSTHRLLRRHFGVAPSAFLFSIAGEMATIFALPVTYSRPKAAQPSKSREILRPAEEPARAEDVTRSVPGLVARDLSVIRMIPFANHGIELVPVRILSSTTSIMPIGDAVMRSTAAPYHPEAGEHTNRLYAMRYPSFHCRG